MSQTDSLLKALFKYSLRASNFDHVLKLEDVKKSFHHLIESEKNFSLKKELQRLESTISGPCFDIGCFLFVSNNMTLFKKENIKINYRKIYKYFFLRLIKSKVSWSGKSYNYLLELILFSLAIPREGEGFDEVHKRVIAYTKKNGIVAKLLSEQKICFKFSSSREILTETSSKYLKNNFRDFENRCLERCTSLILNTLIETNHVVSALLSIEQKQIEERASKVKFYSKRQEIKLKACKKQIFIEIKKQSYEILKIVESKMNEEFKIWRLHELLVDKVVQKTIFHLNIDAGGTKPRKMNGILKFKKHEQQIINSFGYTKLLFNIFFEFQTSLYNKKSFLR